FEILRNTYGTAAKEVLPTLYTWQENLPAFQADGSIPDTRYENIEANITSTIAALEADTPPPALAYFKTVDIVSTTQLGLDSVQLSAAATDLDGGVPRYVWSQVSGPGTVTFSPNGTTASSTTVATFDTPGSYVVRVAVTDRSIMDEVIWWKPHRQLGYYDFQTYDHNYGQAYSSDESIVIIPGANWPPVAYAQDVVTAVDAVRELTLIGFDFDGDALSFSIVTQPAHGSLAGTAPEVSYTPAPGYGGSDSFTFEVTDSHGVPSAAATVSIAVQNPLLLNVTLDKDPATGLVGPAGGLGETWNQPLARSGSGLLDSDGLVTGVSFSCSASNLGQWGSPQLEMLRGGAFNWSANDAYALNISGLAVGKQYDLSLASFHPNEDGSKALFSTSNPTDTASPQIADNGGPNGNSSTWVDGVNYVQFLNVEPDASGDIDFTIDGDDTTGNRRRAYLSGFQLVALPPVPPAAPTGLAAVPGDAQVELSWEASTGATSYIVKRASTPGGPYTTRANPATTRFLDAPAVNGTTWYYVISAVDAYGEGTPSTEVSATPQELLAPAAPAGLAATPGDAQVALTWDAAPGATSYNVKRATSPGGSYRLIASPATTSYQDASVLNGMTWYYVVSAVNSAGESADSAEAAALPLQVTLLLSVNIDSVTRTGLVGPAGGFGAVWNQVGKSGSTSQAVNLLDPAGSPTGIGYQVHAPGNLDNWGAPGGLAMLANSVYNGSWGRITGLTAGTAYNLYIASYYNNEQGSKGDFVTVNSTSNGMTQSVDNGWPAISEHNYNSSSWVQGENYVVFQDIVADGAGEINLSMTAASDGGRNPKLMVSGFQLEEIGSESLSPYSAWAADPAQGLTAGANDAYTDDPDFDGIANLLEFVLGGDPLLPSHPSLPTLSPVGDAWVFEYERSNLSHPPATTQVVEYGNDLVNWTPVTIPATSAGIVTITPGSPSDHVRVTLPNLGATGFARLRVSE
ncbi:MAG: cadherin-like domain-containing protein, partial [Akkermansiaceae bacterium]|nr:cadherin-like domain-containing protein [Akkermansiaceae bacterium]